MINKGNYHYALLNVSPTDITSTRLQITPSYIQAYKCGVADIHRQS
jgi:hypothetical protein